MNENDAASDKQKPVTWLEVQILFKASIFSQNFCKVKCVGKKYSSLLRKLDASVHNKLRRCSEPFARQT